MHAEQDLAAGICSALVKNIVVVPLCCARLYQQTKACMPHSDYMLF